MKTNQSVPESFKLYLYILYYSPVLAYFIYEVAGFIPYYFIGSISSILFFGFYLKKNSKIIIPNYIWLFVFLLIYYFMWDLFNGRYDKFGLIKLLFKNLTLHTICVLLFIENIVVTDKIIAYSERIFKITIVLSLVLSLLQQYINSNIYIPGSLTNAVDTEIYEIRNYSIWGYLQPIDISITFVIISAIVIESEIKKKGNLLLLWYFILFVVAIIEKSRGTIVNALLVLLIAYLNKERKEYSRSIRTVLIILAISLFLYEFMVFAGLDPLMYYENRILSTSAESRFLAIDLFMEYFPKSMFFGSGVHVADDLAKELAGRSSQIHVGYLSHLYEYGLLGSIFLFSAWYLIAKRFYDNAKKNRHYAPIIGFMCFIVANFTLVEYSIYYYGIIYCFIYDKYYTDKYRLERTNRTTLKHMA